MEHYAEELEEQAAAAFEKVEGLDGGSGHPFEVRIKGGVSEVSFKDDIDRIAGRTCGEPARAGHRQIR